MVRVQHEYESTKKESAMVVERLADIKTRFALRKDAYDTILDGGSPDMAKNGGHTHPFAHTCRKHPEWQQEGE